MQILETYDVDACKKLPQLAASFTAAAPTNYFRHHDPDPAVRAMGEFRKAFYKQFPSMAEFERVVSNTPHPENTSADTAMLREIKHAREILSHIRFKQPDNLVGAAFTDVNDLQQVSVNMIAPSRGQNYQTAIAEHKDGILNVAFVDNRHLSYFDLGYGGEQVAEKLSCTNATLRVFVYTPPEMLNRTKAEEYERAGNKAPESATSRFKLLEEYSNNHAVLQNLSSTPLAIDQIHIRTAYKEMQGYIKLRGDEGLITYRAFQYQY